jgi:hypothetical protein
MEKENSAKKLIEEYTKEGLKEPDINKNLQIAELVKNDRAQAKEAVDTFEKIFKGQKMKRCYLALQMLEVISKHSSIEFHEYLSRDIFLLEFIKIFKVLRGKGGLFSRFESKAKKEMRENVEDLGLYLLQLWADTFMMYQDKYPGFQRYYRQLKVEGVKFPDRDLNERTMMENLEGIDSPMFDFVVQSNEFQKKETPNKKRISSPDKIFRGSDMKKEMEEETKKSKFADNEDKIEMDPDTELDETEMKLKILEEVKDYIEEKHEWREEIDSLDYSEYENKYLNLEVFEEAKKNVELLNSMLQN